MHRKQFTFYESFFEALELIEDQDDQAEAYRAICRYALRGEEPELERLPAVVRIVFLLIRPTLDASRRKAASGLQGGPAKNSKTKANEKQTASEGEKENEIEIEKEVEVEIEREHECAPPAPSRGQKKQTRTPSYEQVLEEAALRGRPELAKGFFDYYAAGDWRDAGGRPVRAWRQKLAAWIIRQGPPGAPPGAPQGAPPSSSWAALAETMDWEEAAQ